MGRNTLIHCTRLQSVDHLTAALCLCLYLVGGGLNERERQNKGARAVLQGGARSGAGRGSSAGRVPWKRLLQGASGAGTSSSRVSSKGLERRKGFQQGVPAGVPTVAPFLFVTETVEKAVAALVGSMLQLSLHTAIKGKARAKWRHHIQTIM